MKLERGKSSQEYKVVANIWAWKLENYHGRLQRREDGKVWAESLKVQRNVWLRETMKAAEFQTFSFTLKKKKKDKQKKTTTKKPTKRGSKTT